jgi:hypothetical protein
VGKLARVNAERKAAGEETVGAVPSYTPRQPGETVAETENGHTVVVAGDQDVADALAQHEATIERGLQSFIDVGEALAAIRDGRLYRDTHRSFDAYLADRWPDLGKRNYANKIIRAAQVAAELGTAVPTAAPVSEWQVRPLLALKDPDERLNAWQGAVEHAIIEGRQQPTAADVEAAVTARKPPAAKKRYPVVDPEEAAQHWRDSRSPRDIILPALRVLDTIATTLGRVEEGLASGPLAELWGSLDTAERHTMSDVLARIQSVAASINDRIDEVEAAAAST